MHDPRPWRITLDALDTLIERAALDPDLGRADLEQLAIDLEHRATTLGLAARRRSQPLDGQISLDQLLGEVGL